MKAKTLAKMLGIKKRYNYDSALYRHDYKESSQKDFLEEKKLSTREGHLE